MTLVAAIWTQSLYICLHQRSSINVITAILRGLTVLTDTTEAPQTLTLLDGMTHMQGIYCLCHCLICGVLDSLGL